MMDEENVSKLGQALFIYEALNPSDVAKAFPEHSNKKLTIPKLRAPASQGTDNL